MQYKMIKSWWKRARASSPCLWCTAVPNRTLMLMLMLLANRLTGHFGALTACRSLSLHLSFYIFTLVLIRAVFFIRHKHTAVPRRVSYRSPLPSLPLYELRCCILTSAILCNDWQRRQPIRILRRHCVLRHLLFCF